MAGDWIKWTKGLSRKKEILSMSARLKLSPSHISGICMTFWEWLDDNTGQAALDEKGNACVTLGSLQPEFLDSLVMVNGFAAAMTAEGWICFRSGSLVVPNYTRHNGQTAKDRALTAERVAMSRARKCNADTVTDVTPPPLPEKRREEKIIKKEELPAFKAFNDLWCKTFKEFFGESYKFQAGKDGIGTNSLIKMEGYTPERLIEIAKKAWSETNHKSWYSINHSRTIHGFSTYFNQIRNEVGMLKAAKPSSWSDPMS